MARASKAKASSMPVIICANWKMYKTIDEAVEFINTLKGQQEASADCIIYIAIPFCAIKPCFECAQGSGIVVGAQNMNDASEGAFTGEVAASMLKDAGASFVILGHSERRRLFGETNEFINQKVKRALQSDLRPLLCIGESYEERLSNATEATLEKQIKECLTGLDKSAIDSLIVAYEPLWAIGTGQAATPEVISEALGCIRKVLIEIFGKSAEKIPLLYGGSVTAANASQFLDEKETDGLLIGSASLHPESFAKIIKIGQNVGQLSREGI